ncbi:MAG: isoprenylcysteine carboxylmethyltransferase family protein, partial [Planctomycetes bacterium]|nr:isoprenylcysteine carboxylmethyltransferase family protein [Planctomycetota bacterium]
MSKTTLQGLIPTIFTLIGIVVFVGLGYYQLAPWPPLPRGLGIALMVLYVGWMVGEGKVIVGEIKQDETKSDKGSFELYAIGRFCTILSALAMPGLFGPAETTWVLAIGLSVFVIGVGFRLWAIRTLGRFYSHRVRQQDDHKIVQSGPYRILRHPAYTGMLVAHVGFVVFFFNWVSLGLLCLFFLPAVAYRIVVEERMLFEIEGYPEFAAKRWRL